MRANLAATELLPLRQCVRPSAAASLAFASRALLAALSRPGKFQIASYGEGGLILAANEPALAEARLVLQQAYGERVAFAEPMVHTWVDPIEETLMVPVMFLRVDAPKAHAQVLIDELKKRAAEVQDVDLQRNRVVVRAAVRLADLLGFEQQAQAATDGTSHVLAWLVGYESASTTALSGQDEPRPAAAEPSPGARNAAPRPSPQLLLQP
jgi:hypothetical protein